MNDLLRQFERFALVSLEKQARLFSFLGEHALEIDLEAGTARFGDGRMFPFQVLGTESENSLTWLWAWADEQTEVPVTLLAAAVRLRSWGEQEGLPEFTLPSIDLDRADGNMLSIIASEVCAASGYYRDHYEGGALFILLTGVPLDERERFDRQGLVRQLGDLAQRYDFDHRNALRSYFQAREIPFAEAGDALSAELATGERIVAEFDPAGQARTINGQPLR